MTKNKKRKANEFQHQKIAKAQHKNEFLLKLEGAINLSCGKSIFELIPNNIKNEIYENRNLSVLIKPGESQLIPNDIMKKMKEYTSLALKETYIQFTEDDRYISLNDFFSVFLSILSLEKMIKYGDFIFARIVKDELIKIAENEELLRTAFSKLSFVITTIALQFSNLQKQLYYFDIKNALLTINGLHIQHQISVYCCKPEIAHVKIHQENRPVIRFGLAIRLNEITYLSIKPSDLNLKNTFASLPHDVYIQSHALNRLKERLDCMDERIIYFTLFIALSENPKLCFDKYNHKMLEFKFFETKLGYLPIEITDGKIVIKTFLFITNNVTPEGIILEKYSGFQKEEHKHLSLDKLSTFMSSDIGENIELRSFLKKSGCNCMIELFEQHKDFFKTKSETYSLSKMIDLIAKNSDYKKENEEFMQYQSS